MQTWLQVVKTDCGPVIFHTYQKVMNLYKKFQIVITVNCQTHESSDTDTHMLHLKRCVIIIIFQLWQNFLCNTPCVGTVNMKVMKSREVNYRERSLHCIVLQFGSLKWSNKKHVLLTSSSTST